MKVNPTYRSLLDKSVGSMLSAIEIYNKPDFQYREETFSILAVNAWELLLKAYLLKINKFKLQSIYSLQPAKLRNGSDAKNRKIPVLNRCGNPCTISIFEALKILDGSNTLPRNLKENIEALIELRDNAIHFYNTQSIEKPVQELGFACIKNYMGIIKKWNLPIDLSKYNFYLMPLAYVDEKKFVEGELTREVENYINLIKNKIKKEVEDDDFDIAVSIDLNFKKGNTFDSIGVKYDENGTEITLTEENIRQKYPLTYRSIVDKCTKRYSNFKQNKDFYKLMKDQIKGNEKFCKKRLLDPNNPKTQAKDFYNSNVFSVLDKYYNKVK